MIRTCFEHQELAGKEAERLNRQFPDAPETSVFNTVECDFCITAEMEEVMTAHREIAESWRNDK